MGRKRGGSERGERSEELLARIENLISTICFSPGGGVSVQIISGSERMGDFDPKDGVGTDIRLVLAAEFADFVGAKELAIQVKSSEAGVEQFANPGRKKFGSTSEEWRRTGRILLDGGWTDGSIKTDFLVQLMNLMGIWGHEEEVGDFISCLDRESAVTFGQNFLQIEQYRCHLLEWVAGKPRVDNGGKVFYFD